MSHISTSLIYINLPQSLPYIITSSIIWKKNIVHAYWFTTVSSVHYHLLNNMEKKHRSWILTSTVPSVHYHLLSNMVEKHRSWILTTTVPSAHYHLLNNIEEKHRSYILIYHSHLNKLSPFTHHHLLNDTEEKHRSSIYLKKTITKR